MPQGVAGGAWPGLPLGKLQEGGGARPLKDLALQVPLLTSPQKLFPPGSCPRPSPDQSPSGYLG